MSRSRSKKILAALAGISLMAIGASAASADPWHGGGHGWHGDWHGGHGGPVVVVRPGFYRPPPPVYYAPPPPVYYAPPPAVYYAPPPPPPAYYVPAPSVSFRFRL